MIYIFGVPAAVAAGSELFLAMFMGAYGALTYAFAGMVDIRLTLLLYAGSLLGIHIGAYGTKVVKEIYIRLVTSVIILLCVISRAVAVPIYLQQLDYTKMDASWNPYLNDISMVLLYASGIVGTLIIFLFVIRAYLQRRKIEASLSAGVPRSSRALPETGPSGGGTA
jgi:hypothetical protein